MAETESQQGGVLGGALLVLVLIILIANGYFIYHEYQRVDSPAPTFFPR